MLNSSVLSNFNARYRPYWVLIFALLSSGVIRVFPPTAWIAALTRNYLPLHLMIEVCVVVVSFGIATVGLATFRNTRDLHILAFSCASICIGFFDLGHAMTFAGMPSFFGESSANKTIAFWLLGRSLGATTYLYVALSRPKTIRSHLNAWRYAAIILALSVTIASYFAILLHPEWLPKFFDPTRGLTALKINCEWAFALLSAVASILLFRKSEVSANLDIRWAGCACGVYAICGYFFTIYTSLDDYYVFVGHWFKIASYLLIYRAVFAECVEHPYEKAEALAGEAAAANLAKSRFLANVSHEFRSPLGVISGFCELVLDSKYLDDRLRDSLMVISRNSRQLGFLINDLLDLTKAEQEKIEIKTSRFDLALLIEEVFATFSIQASGKQVTLAFERAKPGPIWVASDEVRVRQILVNLISNALKFTRAGSIRIELTGADESARISVRDSGIGIAAADLEKLFTPFTQLGDPSRRTFGGTGLGLSVSRNLARILGGDLELHRSAPGEGSEFHFKFKDHSALLKTHCENQNAAPEATRNSIAPSLADFNLLIAEDSPDNQALLEAYLKPTNVRLTFAENGKEAVTKAMAGAFDLLLMDIQMPEMDGFEATHNLRKSGWHGPIVALTAHALQPERERAMQSGFDGYLIKPISQQQLWDALVERFEDRGADPQLRG